MASSLSSLAENLRLNSKTSVRQLNILSPEICRLCLVKVSTRTSTQIVGVNYILLEEKYNFTDLTFSTPIAEIKIFEKK